MTGRRVLATVALLLVVTLGSTTSGLAHHRPGHCRSGKLDCPAPPPSPAPTPSGAYWNETWESGVVPSGWNVEQKAWPPGSDNPHAQYAFADDPFGAGQGSVLRLRVEHDPALPVDYSQRLLSSLWLPQESAHAGISGVEETWYRVRLGFPAGNVFSSGQWNWFVEWHTDNDTQSRGGNSPGLAVEGGYPLLSGGTTSPRGLVLVWRAGNPSSPTETYWPSSGNGAFSEVRFIPLAYDRYYESVFRVVWSDDPALGRLDWWLDGQLQVGRNMATLYTNPNTPTGMSIHGFGLYNYRYNVTGTSDAYFGDFLMGPSATSVGLS